MGIYSSKSATPAMLIKTVHDPNGDHPLDETILTISRVDKEIHVTSGKAKMVFDNGESASTIARAACLKAFHKGDELKVSTNFGAGGDKVYNANQAKELAEAITSIGKQLKTIKHLAIKA